MTAADTVTIGDIEVSGLAPQQKAVVDALMAGASLRDLRGLNAEDVEAAYALGFNLYTQGKYAEAEHLFEFAALYGPTEARYWNGLGGCRQMLKKYKAAVDAYGMAHFFSTGDPWPAIHTAICFLALSDKDNARDALTLGEKTIAATKPNPAASQRIGALRQGL